jgi:alkanesulfonate monooxygenase SsuD/methylene tetrahydromethanopterin reductase-like flavin-dependent oxidoreductase (luciferase family)
MTWSNRLGAVGVWRGVNDLDPAMAEAIEELGFGTIWQGGSPGSDLRGAEDLLDATESLQLATGIVNIWKSDPAELADSYHRVEARYPGRLLLGIGSGHREATPSGYARLMRWPGISTFWTSTACRKRPGRFRRWVRGCWSWRPHGVPARIRT